MPRAKKAGAAVPVEATVHREASRTNIPTSELEGFLRPEDRAPRNVLYPRDPTLDPQLVWKGKDDQDREPLEVPAVPIYIQEKIAPKALMEDLRRRSSDSEQPSLFADFNGIAFDDLVDFYRHQQNWSNRMILGDSLLVMTSLAEKEALKGQVQCIYIDPPYGIKFGSNWQASTAKRDVKDGRIEDATRQPEQIKAFRDTWELGVHSYLTYLRDRLTVARELLAETGSVFVQIGDENVHLVRAVMDEVFGSKNFCAQIAFAKTAAFSADLLSRSYDFLLWYARDAERVKYRRLWTSRRERTEGTTYSWVELPDGAVRRMTGEESRGDDPLPPGSRRFRADTIVSPGVSSAPVPIRLNGQTFLPSPGTHWKTTKEGMERLITAGRVVATGKVLAYKRFEDDFPFMPFTNVWDDTILGTFSQKLFVVQTSPLTIERCLFMTTDPGDLVLDPTCGSGTTAFVAEQWGRRWITVDTSRVALAIARTRLMSAKYPLYVLADSAEGAHLQQERTGKAGGSSGAFSEDVRKGFVYKNVPHVTLKSIAYNTQVTEGMDRKQVEDLIRRGADTEVLFDQPESSNRTIRVSGPFTVESLSPHLSEPTAEPVVGGAGKTGLGDDTNRFERLVLEHLRTAGVQNTIRQERLMFDSLEPWPGRWIHASGEYQENGQAKRVAVCIGPEYGTVTSELVREAAKEAVKHFDLLVVCGFAFDGYVSEESKQLGNLTILRATMNPDISLGEELLKKTGAGNLFVVFGEPDIELTKNADQWTVTIRGLDIYDPTTGEVRSQSTDDIACWFIDTDYNGESFFVRHAYFLGREDPYDQLRRALRAEISEEAWAAVRGATSRPFDPPATGKIAVKVINHYGDEVLKVYSS